MQYPPEKDVGAWQARKKRKAFHRQIIFRPTDQTESFMRESEREGASKFCTGTILKWSPWNMDIGPHCPYLALNYCVESNHTPSLRTSCMDVPLKGSSVADQKFPPEARRRSPSKRERQACCHWIAGEEKSKISVLFRMVELASAWPLLKQIVCLSNSHHIHAVMKKCMRWKQCSLWLCYSCGAETESLSSEPHGLAN